MALEYGFAHRDPATKLIQWQTFQLTSPSPRQAATYERVFRETVCPCSNDCGDFITSPEIEQYPKTYIIDLTTGIGDITFEYTRVDPTRFQVEYLNTIIFDSGFIGDPARQYELDVWLAAHGYPSETITYDVTSSYTFPKYSAQPQEAFIHVYAPLPGYDYSFSLSCPQPFTTTTSTSTSTSTSSTSTTSTSTSTTTTTSSSTTSTTTTLPPRFDIEWEFDASAVVIGVKLTATTVEDSEGTKLYDNEFIDLTVVNTNSRSDTNTLPTYSFTMTSVSDGAVNFEIYRAIDGGAETLYQASTPFLISDVYSLSGITVGAAVSSVKYRVAFIPAV